MTEMSASSDQDRLVPYLLGILPDELRQQIDDRLLTDEVLFESLRATENELVYDYALSLLDDEERARFEARFPRNTAIRRKVQHARRLLSHAREVEQRSAPRPLPAWVGWVPLAAAAVAIVVAGWLSFENGRLRDRLAFSNRIARAAVESAAQSAREASPSAGTPASPSPPIVVSMVLQPGAVRSDARARRIRLSPDASALRLQLDLPSGAKAYASYRAFLRTPDDVEVWSGAIGQPEGGPLVATIPASTAKPNDYEVVLSGVSPSGSLEEIASYTFSVLR